MGPAFLELAAHDLERDLGRLFGGLEPGVFELVLDFFEVEQGVSVAVDLQDHDSFEDELADAVVICVLVDLVAGQLANVEGVVPGVGTGVVGQLDRHVGRTNFLAQADFGLVAGQKSAGLVRRDSIRSCDAQLLVDDSRLLVLDVRQEYFGVVQVPDVNAFLHNACIFWILQISSRTAVDFVEQVFVQRTYLFFVVFGEVLEHHGFLCVLEPTQLGLPNVLD